MPLNEETKPNLEQVYPSPSHTRLAITQERFPIIPRIKNK